MHTLGASAKDLRCEIARTRVFNSDAGSKRTPCVSTMPWSAKRGESAANYSLRRKVGSLTQY
jgi:hypothetical protein